MDVQLNTEIMTPSQRCDTRNGTQTRPVDSTVEIKRFFFQIEDIREFSLDKDACDSVETIIKLLEQCLNQKVFINSETVTIEMMSDML